MNSAAANDISMMDNKLVVVVEDLDTIIFSNIILQRYKMAINAFQRFVFPFVKKYLKDLTLPEHLKLNKNTTDLVNNNVEEEISEILTKINTYKSHVGEENLKQGYFNSQGTSVKPFFTWENEEHKYAIAEFLSGKEVVLNADITKAMPFFNAVKFNLIELYLTTKNVTNQEIINETLKCFEINLTHLGDSHYIFNNKTYLIKTNIISMSYYFEKNSKGERNNQSNTHKAIANGDYMLSPYTLWKVWLEYIPTCEAAVTFDDLKIFKDEIKLELGGYGSYVKSSALQEDDYYKSFQTCDVVIAKDKNTVLEKREIGSESNDKKKLLKRILESKENSKSDSWFTKNFKFDILPAAEAAAQKISSSAEKLFEWKGQKNRNFVEKIKINVIEDEWFSKNEEMDNVFSKKSTVSHAMNSFVHKIWRFSEIIPSKFMQFFSGLPHKNDEINSSTYSAINDHIGYNQEAKNNLEINLIDSPIKHNILKIDLNHGNLLLAQYIIGQKFGTNKALCTIDYSSPAHERNLKINELSMDIVPELKRNSANREPKIFLHHYDDGSEWYREIFNENIEKLHLRSLKKQLVENTFPDEIFSE